MNRVLIVDDDEFQVVSLVDIFNTKGFEAEGAFNGKEGLKKIEEVDYACVISDIRMPEMNGVEFCKAARKIRPNIPFVLMTAYSNDDLVKEGLKEGALLTLNKPLDINSLISYILYYIIK
jgi:DNA-binding NtrC family response regulator